MENKSIFKKIDEFYTKFTQAIIGDMPLEIDETAPVKKQKTTTHKPKQNGFNNTFTTIKNKILSLGTPDEQALLYEEVVKREKQIDNEITTKPVVAQETAPAEETTSSKIKTVKKVFTSKPATKKAPTKKESSTKKVLKKKTTIEKKAVSTSTEGKVLAKMTKKPSVKKSGSIKETPTKVETKKVTPVTEKEKTKKLESQKKVIKSTNVTKSTPRGAKKAAKIALYTKDIQKHYGEVDEAFLAIIVKNLGPSIYKRDAELVSCSDPKELDTVRKNFLIKKLGIDASQGVLDAAIHDVCEELKSAHTKYRATFYYALAKKFKKESVLS